MRVVPKQSKGIVVTYFVLTLIFAALFAVFCLSNNAMLSRQNSITTDHNYFSPAALTDPLVGGSEIQQEILVKGDLREVSVMLGTNSRKNNGKVTLSLWDKDTKLVSRTVLQVQIVDDTPSKLILPEVYSLKEPTLLTLKITTDGSEDNDSISAWRTQNGSGYSDGKMYLNGSLYDADLSFSYKLIKRNIAGGITFWLWIIGGFFILSISYWLLWGKQFYTSLLRMFAAIQTAPLKWLARLGIVAGASSLGLLTEYLYGRFVTGGPASTGTVLNPPRLIFFVAVWVLISLFFILRKQVKSKPEKLFVSIMLILGCMFIWITPVYNLITWDEESHFFWSLGQSFPDNTYVTWTDDILLNEWPPLDFQVATIQETTAELNDNYDDGYTGTIPNAGIDRFITLIGHYPAGLSMALARMFGLSFRWVFMFGKFGNLLTYTIIVYFAIRKLHSGKMLMSAIASMPTPFILATNYSYDYWVTSLIMLAYATYFLELQQPDKRISIRSVSTMLFSMFLACLPKQPYIVMFLPLLFMKKSKFENKRQHIFYLLSVISLGLLVVASLLIVRMKTVGDGDMRGGETVSISGQIQYILSDPVGFFKMILRFLKGYLSYANMGETLTSFAVIGTNGSAIYAFCMLLIIAVTDKSEHDLLTCTGRVRTLTWTSVLLTVFALAAVFYMAFTPVGLDTVSGCQQRYLIPLLFPALFLIGSPRIENKMNRLLYYYLGYGAMAFILIQAIWDGLASKYY